MEAFTAPRRRKTRTATMRAILDDPEKLARYLSRLAALARGL
jgi:hypothetical protein